MASSVRKIFKTHVYSSRLDDSFSLSGLFMVVLIKILHRNETLPFSKQTPQILKSERSFLTLYCHDAIPAVNLDFNLSS